MGKPKIRFKGFDNDWEQRKLGEICSRIQGNDGRMELPILTISAGNGWMKQEDRFSGNIAGKEQKNYTLLKKGELSYNHGNSKLAKYGTVFSLQTYEEALVPRVYHSFKIENGNANFIEYYFATKLPDRELGKLISSGARMDGLLNIGYDDFMGISLLLPKTQEQNHIAGYFRIFDRLITLHQRKCEDTKKLKKYMLQKMFPQNGSKVPEIRFKGFTDDWEQRKLGELGKIMTGSTPSTSKSEYYAEDGIPWVTPTDINSLIISETSRKLSEEGIKVGRVVPANTILCTCIASIGKNALLTVKGSFNQQINSLTPNNENDAYFLLTESELWSDKMKRMAASGTMQIVNKADFSELTTMVPTIGEQEKIGVYFRNLDQLITLHQNKCDELKKIKKYMLQNMFV